LLYVIEKKLTDILAAAEKLHSQAIHTFVNAVVFDTADETYTSASLDVSEYRNFTILLDLAVTLAPTDIVIRVQFSDDDSTFYNLMNGPFGDLRYEDTAGAKVEALTGRIIASYMRIYVVSSGCDATNKFTLTVKAELKN